MTDPNKGQSLIDYIPRPDPLDYLFPCQLLISAVDFKTKYLGRLADLQVIDLLHLTQHRHHTFKFFEGELVVHLQIPLNRLLRDKDQLRDYVL